MIQHVLDQIDAVVGGELYLVGLFGAASHLGSVR